MTGCGKLRPLLVARHQPELVIPMARRLYQDALQADLPELAWALIFQAEAGERAVVQLAQAVAREVSNPALRARAARAAAAC